jgi:phospholipase C
MSANNIQNVFVLMLENRAFDHMLGYSGITGTDAASGQPTQINGLAGTESNTYNGQPFGVSPSAGFVMPADPGHEFTNVLEQLCGSGSSYPPGGPYPPIVNSGFVASYVATGGQDRPGEIMKCFTPTSLPVLHALAREFVVCDNWHASMPGPTWPNRLFVHAASSGGLDHSPTSAEIVLWEALNGFTFQNGTIFDAMKAKNISRRLYAGDDFPMVSALKGIVLADIRPYYLFAQDIGQSNYPFSYTFIEPSYNLLTDYKGSTSQHPLDDVTRGEMLIKATYEAIRNSPRWNKSLLIITWDEHGGFYDHAVPPPAIAPGDTEAAHNKFGFTFDQYGPRVPAIIVSPLIPRNLVDHRLYDHASIPATLEAIFGLNALTKRDAAANNLTSLVSLSIPRTDAPATLPAPAQSGLTALPNFAGPDPIAGLAEQPPASRPLDGVNDGNLPGVLHAALRSDLALSPPEQRPQILAHVSSLKNRAEASRYLHKVKQKIRASKSMSPATA